MTKNKLIFKGESDILKCRTCTGYITILKDHMPLVARVQEINVFAQGKELIQIKNPGLLFIRKNIVQVIL